jgi:hypothetical protein
MKKGNDMINLSLKQENQEEDKRMATTKRTNEEWLALHQKQRESGMTLGAWCAENGVNVYTMAGGVSRLRKADLITEARPPGGRYPVKRTDLERRSADETPEWVEVPNVGAPEEIRASPSGGIHVEMGMFRVVISADFQEAALTRVCKALMCLC